MDVDNAVMAVENGVHLAIMTAVDNVVNPRVEIAVGSITESSGRGFRSMVKNPDQRDFTGNTENSPLMSALAELI